MVVFVRQPYVVRGRVGVEGGGALSQNGNSKTLTRASDCTTHPHWHCDNSEVSKSSTENPFYWQMWLRQEDLAGRNWWRCSEHLRTAGGPQKKSCWTPANEERVKPKLLVGRTLSLSSKGSLIIRLTGGKSMFGGVARNWEVEWGSVGGCI